LMSLPPRISPGERVAAQLRQPEALPGRVGAAGPLEGVSVNARDHAPYGDVGVSDTSSLHRNMNMPNAKSAQSGRSSSIAIPLRAVSGFGQIDP
jgi:hypothetical protein